MKIPSLEEADALIIEARNLYNSRWIEHSIMTGRATQNIALHIPTLLYLSNVEYNEYDKLIQLCDILPLPTGYCLLDKLMIDIAIRWN